MAGQCEDLVREPGACPSGAPFSPMACFNLVCSCLGRRLSDRRMDPCRQKASSNRHD